jgi:hypothetical protein
MTAGPTGVEVRLPTLEVYLATQGNVFAERGSAPVMTRAKGFA